MPDVLEYLQGKGLRIRRAGGDEVHVPCFWHGEAESERGRLYINVDPNAAIPGLYECKVCDAHGALPSIMRHFGDQPPRADGQPEDDKWLLHRQMLEDAVDYYHHQGLAQHPEALGWLRGPERGLDIETIVKYRIGYADGTLWKHLRDIGYRYSDMLAAGLVGQDDQNRTTDTLVGMVTIPYMVAGNVATVRGRRWPYDPDNDEGKYKTLPRSSVRLWNTDGLWGAEDVILTEGEFDAMVLLQMGFDNVVALPGANVWQESWHGYVADMRRIFTVFDNDKAGSKGLAKLMEKHGRKIRQIDLSDGSGDKIDPTKWVSRGGTQDEFARLMRERGGSGLLLTVDHAFEEHQSVQGQEGLKFNVELLDMKIAPGMLPGQVMIVLAKSGTGKTIWLLNMFHRMSMVKPDFRCLFISLEQTRGEWFERANRINRFYNLRASDQDTLNYWRPRILLTDKNRLNEDDFVSIIDDYEETVGAPPDVIGLDYLGYFAQSFKGDRYERVSDAVMSLKHIGKERKVPIIAPHQVSRIAKYGEEPDTDAARDAGVVEETADFLLTMWTQDHMLGSKQAAKSGVIDMRIGKSRHGGRGFGFKLQFAPLSLALVPHGDAKSVHLLDRARQEIRYEGLYDHWTTAIRRHAGLLPAGELAGDPTKMTDEELERRRNQQLAKLERDLRP